MRQTTRFFVLALCTISGFVSAQAPTEAAPGKIEPVVTQDISPQSKTETPPCSPDQIEVEAPAPLRLNGRLNLVVKESCKDAVLNQLSKTGAKPGAENQSSGISLLMNHVAMHKLPMTITQRDNPNEILLSIQLRRDSEVEASRQSWDTFLSNSAKCCRSRGRETEVELALAIGVKPAIAIGKSISFRAADYAAVSWTFVVSLIIFAIGCVMIYLSPTLIREAPGGRYSLSRSQMAFWGLIVVLSFVGTWILIGSIERIPDDVLILLGISAATGWLAPYAAANSESVAQTQLGAQKTKLQANAAVVAAAGAKALTEHSSKLAAIESKEAELSNGQHLQLSEGFLRDICSDGDGLCVHRVQAVAWTLILGVIFVCTVLTVISMPVFSTNLLLLLGISNGAYLTLKTREQP